MKDIKHSKQLITLAQDDLTALNGMMSSEIFTEAIFGFHAQQSVEKILKAWLALLGQEYPLTHNLNILLDQLELKGASIEMYRDFSEYTDFAVRWRYEDLLSGTVALNRADTIRRIQGLMDYVLRLML